MKFTIDKELLLANLLIAQDIVSSEKIMTIFSNVMININDGVLTIRATDSSTLAFEKTMRLQEKDNVDGSVCVYCDRLVNAVRAMPLGEITIEEINESSSIRIYSLVNNDLEYIMFTTSIDNYPSFSAAPKEGYMSLSQKHFKNMIDQTIFAVSREEMRLYLSGVYMGIDNDKLVFVASDGRRLSLSTYAGDNTSLNIEKGIIIPTKILLLVRKYTPNEGEIEILIFNDQIFFKIDDIYISSTLIKGDFPNFRRVIPESQQFEVIVNRLKLIKSINDVALFIEKSKRVYLSLSKGKIKIESDKSEIGQAKSAVECRFDGSDITLALNYLYINEPLRVLDGDDIIIEFTENSRAVTIRAPDDTNNIHIAMPMQID